MAIDFHGRNRHVGDPDDSDDANHFGSVANGHHADGSDDGFSDASSDVTELDSGDFPAYFLERDGRLFHSHGGLPYPLPVDTPEQERLNELHRVLKSLLGGNFVGPVSETLTPVPERRKRALDICTGTGMWAMEMASQFPHVKFNGFDIVPIATRDPLPNVQFEMHNVNEPVRWADNTMDFVHARAIDMTVSNYTTFLGEVTRVLRPGGLFLSGEWERGPTFANPGLGDTTSIPAIYRLLYLVDDVLRTKHGVLPAAPRIPGCLAASGRFSDITTEQHAMPIGDWHPDPAMRALGNDFRGMWVRYAHNLKPMLKEVGLDDAHVEQLVAGYVSEMDSVSGMVGVYCTVHAKKV